MMWQASNLEKSPLAQKSTGGKAPRKQLRARKHEVYTATIHDHSGNNIHLVWNPLIDTEERPSEKPYPFPFQVYMTQSAAHTAQDSSFPTEFCLTIDKNGRVSDGDCLYRFEIYSQPLSNVLACVAHQRKEVDYRNRNGIVPRLVSSWTTNDEGYKGRIIVIDRDDWLDTGPVLVHFDPVEYDQPSTFDFWNVAGEGDRDIVRATRCQPMPLLRQRLTEWWHGAGFSWTQEDLIRRNEGGFSPALYPAVDPISHYDADHEDIHELDGEPLANPTALQAAIEDVHDEDDPKICDTFNKSVLFQKAESLPDLREEVYSDSFGFPVTSVWSSKRSKLRPSFSMTLYLGFDMLPIQPKALFACLNKGLIADEAWTLDVVQNMPSLDAAFAYHARSSARRRPEQVAETKQCMQMVLEKIANQRLPSELLEYMEDLLVSPEIPSYASRPARVFKNVFMYLDSRYPSTGPLLVYSNSTELWNGAAARRAGFENPSEILTYGGWKEACFEDDMLRVVFLRYWHRVADEIHILWSMCSPRSPSSNYTDLPHVTLKLSIPPLHQDPHDFTVSASIHYELLLHSNHPIIVPRQYPLSHEVWTEAIEIVDLETDELVPPLPTPRNLWDHYDYPFTSWAPHNRSLGLRGIQHPHSMLQILRPDESSGVMRTSFDWSYLRDLNYHRVLVNGREYAARLKSGVTLPRWTYYGDGVAKGPFNLSPIPVRMEEEVRFTWNAAK